MLSYDSTTGNMKSAAERVLDDLSEALAELQDEVIKNPQNMRKAKAKYEAKLKKIGKQWERDYISWTNNDLAKAYKTGVTEADLQVQQVNSMRKTMPSINVSQELFEEVIENGVSDLLIKQPDPLITLPQLTKYAKGQFLGLEQHIKSYDIYRKAMYENLQGITGQIVRGAQDIYKDVARMVMDTGLHEGSEVTMRRLAKQISEGLAKGKSLFIEYSNGAKVPLDSYSEMVARTMSQKVANEAKLNRFAEKGYDLVRLSSHFRACDLCAQYQGKIFSRSGKSKKYPPLSRAIQGGMFHPNCLHTVSPYFQGLSSDELQVSASPEEQALIDKHGFKKANQIAYKAQQKQRAFERRIRHYKREEALAVNPVDATKHHDKVLMYRSYLRDHLKKNPYLPRDYYRESVPGWKHIVGLSRDEAAKVTQSLAQKAMERAAYNEPAITDIVKKVVTQNEGCFNFGLDFRLKGEGSTMRKITNDYRDKAGYISMEEITDELGDLVRYTYIIEDPDDYARIAQNIAVDLKKEGMENYKWKNKWPGEGYKGINSNWTYKGQRLEIQFHTPESFKVKEGFDVYTGKKVLEDEMTSHHWYEKIRVSSDKAKIKYWTDITNDLWRPVYTPPGVADISIDATEKILLDVQDTIVKQMDEYTPPVAPKFTFERPRADYHEKFEFDTDEYWQANKEFFEKRDAWEKQYDIHKAELDKWADELLNRPLKFQNTDEATAWFRSRGITELEGLEKVDPSAWEDITRAIDKVFDDFPELKNINRSFIVSDQGMDIASWDGGINFNERVISDYDKFIRQSHDHSVINTAYDVTTHELGHGVQELYSWEKGRVINGDFNAYFDTANSISLKVDREISKVLDGVNWNDVEKSISSYGTTNLGELQAEAFAQFYSGEMTSEIAENIVKVHKEMTKNAKEWFDVDELENLISKAKPKPNISDMKIAMPEGSIKTLEYLEEVQERFIRQRRGYYRYLGDPKFADTANKVIKEMEEQFVRIIDNSEVAMRVPGEDVLAQILEEGRFKNQLETGTSMGMVDDRRRKNITHNLFGAETYQMDPKDYEVYGYMTTKDTISDLFNEAQMRAYGDICIKFKPEVRKRTTFTIGDSLDEGAEDLKLIASRLDDPKVCSGTIESIDELETLELANVKDCSQLADWSGVPYVEAQIHGDLMLEDISEISIVAESREDFIAEALNPEQAQYAMDLLDYTDIKVNFYTINDLPH